MRGSVHRQIRFGTGLGSGTWNYDDNAGRLPAASGGKGATQISDAAPLFAGWQEWLALELVLQKAPVEAAVNDQIQYPSPNYGRNNIATGINSAEIIGFQETNGQVETYIGLYPSPEHLSRVVCVSKGLDAIAEKE